MQSHESRQAPSWLIFDVGQDVVKFTKLISFPIRRLKVDDSALPDFQKELRLALDIRGLGGMASDPLVARLVEEAYHRAGRDETDGIPRHGAMEDHLDQIVSAIEVLWRGKEIGDASIDAIGIGCPGTSFMYATSDVMPYERCRFTK